MGNVIRDFFYLNSAGKDLFCVYYYPETGAAMLHILYVHPFGDEMNKSRKQISLQAEAFAGIGIGTLLVDQCGCGDSEGEFRDAAWDIWQQNILDGFMWLKKQPDVPVVLWGLRTGCLLVKDVIDSAMFDIKGLLFWQPVLNGKLFVRQLLRLKKASGLLHKTSLEESHGPDLPENAYVEIGGYQIPNTLMQSMERIQLMEMESVSGMPVIWKELTLSDDRQIPPVSEKVLRTLTDKGAELDTAVVHGRHFWNTVEIEIIPDLIESTTLSVKNIFLKNE